jgi:hypothetical protein
MDKEPLDKRIDAVHDTVKQARSALLLCILASGAMFLCLWNTYASWDRDFAFLDRDDYLSVHSIGIDPNKLTLNKLTDKDNPVLTADQVDKIWNEHKFTPEQTAEAWHNHLHSRPTNLHDHQMHSWIDTQVVSVALLGIKISVSDFAILGSVALAICSLFLLLCVRRENHEIGYLFREMSEHDWAAFGPHAYAMVTSYMVFNITGLHGKTDGVIRTLKEEPETRRIRFIRGASSVLDFFPAITIAATIFCDFGWTFWNVKLGHLFFLSPFRAQSEGSVYWTEFGTGERVYFWCAEIFACIAVFLLFRMSSKIRNYDRGTRDLLEEVNQALIKAGLVKPRWPEKEKN